MRRDMAQVLIERPRTRSWANYRQQRGYNRALSLEEGPQREAIGRRLKSHDKWLSDLFGPLRRYLHSQVGRPWDLVYQEICATNDRRNIAQKHLLRHVHDFVATDVVWREGKLYEANLGTNHPLGRYGWRSFYVCPITKLLKEIPKPVSRTVANRVIESCARQYHRIQGTWYEVALRKAPDEGETCFDALLGNPLSEIGEEQLRATYGWRAYALSSKPVSGKKSRELSKRARKPEPKLSASQRRERERERAHVCEESSIKSRG